MMALATRFVEGRALSFITLLLAAWVLPLAAFADLGVYLSLLNLTWLAFFLRYEQLIVAARGRGNLGAIRVCVVIGCGAWLIVATAAWLLSAGGAVPPATAFLFVCALTVRGPARLAMMAATRNGDFQGLGRMALVHGLVQPIALLAAVFTVGASALALMVSDLVGNAVAAAYIVSRQRSALRAGLSGPWRAARLAALARAWSSLALVNLPSSLMALAFASAPLLLLPLVASPDFAGAGALAMRIFDVPTQIIVAAAVPVLLNRLQPQRSIGGTMLKVEALWQFMAALVLAYGAGAALILLAVLWSGDTKMGLLAGVVLPVALFHSGLAFAGTLAEGFGLFKEQGRLWAAQSVALASAAAIGLACLGDILAPQVALWLLAALALGRSLAIARGIRRMSHD